MVLLEPSYLRVGGNLAATPLSGLAQVDQLDDRSLFLDFEGDTQGQDDDPGTRPDVTVPLNADLPLNTPNEVVGVHEEAIGLWHEGHWRQRNAKHLGPSMQPGKCFERPGKSNAPSL